MPGGKKKPFIDKKNAVSFRLVHRSQRDPLQASEDAPSRVLVPQTDEISKTEKEEHHKYGIYFDDEYDYMQHLYDLNEVQIIEPDNFIGDIQILDKKDVHRNLEVEDTAVQPSLQLPSSVFPSTVETVVGLLNKAVAVRGPQPDWDPDIVAAMDDDFDMEDPGNVLEDDFISQANMCGWGSDESWESDDTADSTNAHQSDSDSADEDGERMFPDEETKSRFTNYSMTSSVMRRNEGLTLLDERFEKLFEEYDDCEIGALEHEEIDGCITHVDPIMKEAIKEFQSKMRRIELQDIREGYNVGVNVNEDESDDDNRLEKLVIERVDAQWDCESILSTYSNIYNHPKLIEGPNNNKKIELTSRLGIPRDILPTMGLTRKQLENEMRESRRADRASTYRAKEETGDERRCRKQAIRTERKERRIEKKSNQMAFKEEDKKQKRERLSVTTTIQGVRIT